MEHGTPRLRSYMWSRPDPICGCKFPLKDGGYVQCDKPGIFVEIEYPGGREPLKCFLCDDHIRHRQQAGCVVRPRYMPKWPPEMKEDMAKLECQVCHCLMSEHSAQEFDDCMDKITAPRGRIRLFPRGKRAAKKEDVARGKCEMCGRRFGEHSQQEYDGCINQLMKRHKTKKEKLAYAECEHCGRLFGEHSSQEYDACVDQIIDNSEFAYQ